MPRFEDLAGRSFNCWTVITLHSKSLRNSVGKKQPTLWKCRCKCGNEKLVAANHLKSGNSKCCGCIPSKPHSQRIIKDIVDLVGKTYGNLTVIEKLPYKKRRSIMWKCKCSCGAFSHRPTDFITSRKPDSICKECILRPKIKVSKVSKKTFSPKENLSGNVIQRFLVLDKWRKTSPRCEWLCRCFKCNKEIWISGTDIKKNRLKSCDCPFPNAEDLSGQKFNRLTVIELDLDRSTPYNIFWKCRCDCGIFKSIKSSSIKSGKSATCGCGRYNPIRYDDDFLAEEAYRRIYSGRRNSPSQSTWSRRVKIRDNFRCILCSSSDKLCAHHLDGWKYNPELRVALSNGVTLCSVCHKSFHRKYGVGEMVTKENFLKFRNEYF